MVRDHDLEAQAAALGYRPEVCEVCCGHGVSRRPDANAPAGRHVENPCSGCEGSGRMWSIRGNVPWLRDREMRELIERHRGAA
jgi:hypothetical protein